MMPSLFTCTVKSSTLSANSRNAQQSSFVMRRYAVPASTRFDPLKGKGQQYLFFGKDGELGELGEPEGLARVFVGEAGVVGDVGDAIGEAAMFLRCYSCCELSRTFQKKRYVFCIKCVVKFNLAEQRYEDVWSTYARI